VEATLFVLRQSQDGLRDPGGKLEQLDNLGTPGTGDAEYDSHFCPGPPGVFLEGGQIAHGLENGFLGLVLAVGLKQLPLGKTARIRGLFRHSANGIVLGIVVRFCHTRSYGSK